MSRDHKYVPIKLGWIYSSEMKRPGHINKEIAGPNYRDISEFNRAGPYLISIEEDRVVINGILIARAPGNFTQTKKTKFLKSVCWALLNDPGALKDKVIELSIPDCIEEKKPDLEPLKIIDLEPLIVVKKGRAFLGPILPGYLPWLKLRIEEIPGPGALS
jgi:hypothetical protein